MGFCGTGLSALDGLAGGGDELDISLRESAGLSQGQFAARVHGVRTRSPRKDRDG